MELLSENEYDSQVVEAEPVVGEYDTSNVPTETQTKLAKKLSEMFEFEINPLVTNWDRKISYPREGNVDYSYHANLYRQLILDKSDVLRLSWIQTKDLELVAERLGEDTLKENLEEFAQKLREKDLEQYRN